MAKPSNKDAGSDTPVGAEQPGVLVRPDGTKYLSPGRAEAFLGLVRAGDAVTRRFNRTLKQEYGLSLHEFEVLLFLAVFADDHTMQMSELRKRTPLSQSRVSRVVAGLESEQLVTRTSDASDTRSVNVTVTPKGVAMFKAAQDSHLADLEHHLFSKLNASEIEQLASITQKILAAPPLGDP